MPQTDITEPTIQRSQNVAPAANKAKGQAKLSEDQENQTKRTIIKFVILLCSFSELASILAFFLIRNAEAALVFQLPGLFFFNRILCHYFPANSASEHPFMVLLQTFLKHKP